VTVGHRLGAPDPFDHDRGSLGVCQAALDHDRG
jgi:hypothetical protein